MAPHERCARVVGGGGFPTVTDAAGILWRCAWVGGIEAGAGLNGCDGAGGFPVAFQVAHLVLRLVDGLEEVTDELAARIPFGVLCFLDLAYGHAVWGQGDWFAGQLHLIPR